MEQNVDGESSILSEPNLDVERKSAAERTNRRPHVAAVRWMGNRAWRASTWVDGVATKYIMPHQFGPQEFRDAMVASTAVSLALRTTGTMLHTFSNILDRQQLIPSEVELD